MDEITRTCLVIDTRKLSTLRLDGPAIKLQGQNNRLFPLRRLSRVHVIGQIDCGFDALMVCAERQIPVAFFTIQGKLRCQLYYPVLEHSFLAHWLDHMEFDIDAKTKYGEWLSNQTLYLLAAIKIRSGPIEHRLDLATQLLHSQCKKVLGDKLFNEATQWLEGMLNAHLSQLLVSYGLSNQSRNKRRLQEDILPLMTVWLLHKLSSGLQQGKVKGINGHTMSSFYQCHSTELGYIAQRMLVQLSSLLESIV